MTLKKSEFRDLSQNCLSKVSSLWDKTAIIMRGSHNSEVNPNYGIRKP